MKPHLLLTAIAFVVMLVAGAIAADLPVDTAKEPTVSIVWSGPTTLTTALATKSATEKLVLIASTTDTLMKDAKYPLLIPDTEVTIDKYRCDSKTGICWYWITATRGGKTVATNSPILLVNPPYATVISEVTDTKANTLTVTIKEDPIGAVYGILQSYADRQPIGKPTVGTKE